MDKESKEKENERKEEERKRNNFFNQFGVGHIQTPIFIFN